MTKTRKRILSLAMAMVMIFTLLPTTALAEEPVHPTAVATEVSSPVQITKKVESDGDNYKITMDSYVTGKVVSTTPTPLDIVLVLDVSGSMADDISIVEQAVYKQWQWSKTILYLDFKHGGGEYYYSKDGSEPFYRVTNIEYVIEDVFREWKYTYSDGTSEHTVECGVLGQAPIYYQTSVQTTVSKMDALKTAVNGFIDATAEKNQGVDSDSQHRISIVKFAGTESTNVGDEKYEQGSSWDTEKVSYNYTQIVKELTAVDAAGQNELKTAVNKLTAAGATAADWGLKRAQAALQGSTRQKVVVFFTDGEPNHGNGFDRSVAKDAVNTAKAMKADGVTIFTVGVLKNANPDDTTSNINKFMNAVSSNYPGATASNGFNVSLGVGKNDGYYKKATSADELDKIFGDIVENLVPDMVADETSVLKDTVSDMFVPVGVTADETTHVVTNGVKVEQWKVQDGAWVKETDITDNVNVKLEGKTLSVTGFDYSSDNNVVVKNPDGTLVSGRKLVLSFDVAPDATYEDWTAGANYYDTNDTSDKQAGLYIKDHLAQEAALTDSPEVQVTAYAVTYDANAADATGNVPDAKAYLPGSEVLVAGHGNLKRDDHDFAGWNTESNGSGTLYEAGATFNVTGNTTLYAQWTENGVTVTFNANGGAWDTENLPVGYTMDAQNMTASKNVAMGTVITEISPAPKQSGKEFTGWYYDVACTESVVFSPYAKLYMDVTLHAGWKDTEPDSVSYTIRQHYIGEDGVEDAAVNLSGLSAPEGTQITTLYADKAKNQTYYYQNYIYVDEDTKVDPKGDTLTHDGTTIDLYYYLDEWSDPDKDNDPDKPGDGIPDKYQAKVTFKVVNGTWADDTSAAQEFVKTLYQKNDAGEWELIDPAPTLTVPTGMKPATGYDESTGAWSETLGETVEVTGNATYTYTFGDKSSCVITVNYLLEGTTTQLQDSQTKTVKYGDPYDVTEWAYASLTASDGKHYVKDSSDRLTGFALGAVNINVYYTADDLTDTTKDDPTPNEPGDGIPDKYQAILKYVADSHSTVSGTTTKVITLKDAAGNYVASKTMTPGTDGVTYKIDSDYKFNGWEPNPNVEQTINGGRTYTFKVTTSYDGKVEDDSYELRYDPNGGTVNPRYESKNDPWVKDYDELPVPTRPGYVFTGWYDKNGKLITDDVKVDKTQVIITAGWRASSVPGMLNGDDHFAYIQGYADGTVRPNNYITRAQVATIFFRLLDEDIRDENLTTYNDFPDVAVDYWANTAISTMTELGVIHGYKDGNFRPNAYITRAEFAAICARFDDTVKSGNSSFTDINGHWAKAEIERAATLGWIQGYSDGTFRPNNNITRAQAMTMINRVLCRLPEDEDDLLRGMNTWTDCNPGDWCYLAVQEATNSHDFQHRGVYESWTDLNRDPDWSKYEN